MKYFVNRGEGARKGILGRKDWGNTSVFACATMEPWYDAQGRSLFITRIANKRQWYILPWWLRDYKADPDTAEGWPLHEWGPYPTLKAALVVMRMVAVDAKD